MDGAGLSGGKSCHGGQGLEPASELATHPGEERINSPVLCGSLLRKLQPEIPLRFGSIAHRATAASLWRQASRKNQSPIDSSRAPANACRSSLPELRSEPDMQAKPCQCPLRAVRAERTDPQDRVLVFPAKWSNGKNRTRSPPLLLARWQ